MPRGMRVIEGNDAIARADILATLRLIATGAGLEEVVFPSVWEQQTFIDKAGPEVLNQMYTFKDKGDRDLCLIPEVTGVVQEWYRGQQKPRRIFYESRCYRYERPQAGRYREFTQFGVEILGLPNTEAVEDAQAIAARMMRVTCPDAEFAGSVKRGLAYYIEAGFEYSVPTLGAQKQVLGGGAYAEGVGFAIGVDRLLLAEESRMGS